MLISHFAVALVGKEKKWTKQSKGLGKCASGILKCYAFNSEWNFFFFFAFYFPSAFTVFSVSSPSHPPLKWKSAYATDSEHWLLSLKALHRNSNLCCILVQSFSVNAHMPIYSGFCNNKWTSLNNFRSQTTEFSLRNFGQRFHFVFCFNNADFSTTQVF